ncbi:MAG: SDR family NAD(P)-dependent oxidoreductase, partial [Acidimicrobiales bacterium]
MRPEVRGARARSGSLGLGQEERERMDGAVVVLGGTAGIGRELAVAYARRGKSVVLSGRDATRAAEVAAGIMADVGSGIGTDVGAGVSVDVTGIGVDLAEPASIREALEPIGPVRHLVIGAIERDVN